MAKIFCITNQKGGVGKTTTCACLATALSELDKKVLIIDLDPQAGLTTSLGYEPDSFPTTIYDVLINSEKSSILTAIIKTKINNVDFIPSNLDLAGAEAELIGEIGWDRTLKETLYPIRNNYDYILIDCPPSLGVLTANALVASELAIIPLQTEYLAMKGLKQLNKVIDKVRKRTNPNIQTKILRTMFDKRTLHGKEVLEEIKNVFKDKVFEPVISRTIKFADSSVAGEPILLYDKESEPANAYRQLAKEILKI
ncbi:MAG: ParA family protein [Desulfobacterales bacterium]|nr:ParA family protein [Desulfobacterales bacterium]